MPTRLRSIACALLVLAASACGGKGKDAPADETLRSMVRSMSLLAGDVLSEDEEASWTTKLANKEATTDELIELLVSSPYIGSRVAPNLLFASFLNVKNYYAVPSMFTLKVAEPQGSPPIYFLRKACRPDEAVSVRPWWDLTKPVLVCPDSYRPEKWTLAVEEHSYRTRMPLSCDSQVGSPEKEDQSLCGCGPNLIRCLSDEDVFLDMHASMQGELRDTTAHIVNENEPLASLFTTNYSMRDRNTEYLYQRRAIASTEGQDVDARVRKLRQWPDTSTWARREEQVVDEQAGVLTGVQLLTWLPDRRQRQRGYMEVLWCSGRDSFGATTEKIFEVSNSSNLAFTHDSWERLAHTDTCTKCHARLDYGFQFFMGYPDARAGNHYVPSLAREGQGPMYGDDINDPRGETHLAPAAFARLATKQPEFATCMASHVSNYVLGPSAPQADHQEVLASFVKDGRFKNTMKTALRIFARRSLEKAVTRKPVKAAEPAVAAVDAPGQDLKLSSATRTALEDNCLDCHDDSDKPFLSVGESYGQAVYLGGEIVSRELATRMLEQVAYLNMPRGKTLEHPVREAMVRGLIAAMWPAGAERTRAEEYYLGQLRALEALQIDVAFDAERKGALEGAVTGDEERAEPSADEGDEGAEEGAGKGVERLQWGAIERAIYADQSVLTPGFLAMMALDAAENCAVHGDNLTAFEACLHGALRLDHMARWTH